MDQYDRQDRGETRHEDRFAQELADQLHPVRTQHLSHAHFPGAHLGTGRGQVNEVDASDNQDQERDGHEEGHVPYIAVGFVLALPVRIEVYVHEGLERRPQADARLPVPVARVTLQKGRQFRFEITWRNILAEPDVGVQVSVIFPVVQVPAGLYRSHRAIGYEHVRPHVGIGRNVLHDARHREVPAIVEIDRIADGLFVAEVLEGQILRDHHRIRLGERDALIPRGQRNAEHLEQVGSRPDDFAFIVDGVSEIDQPRGFGTSQPDDKLDLGEVALQGGSPARGRPGRLNGLAPTFDIVDDAVHAVGMGMIPVVAELILDVQEDQDAGGHADCEPGDIDERVGGMPAEIAQGHAEVIPEHLCLFRSVGVATVVVTAAPGHSRRGRVRTGRARQGLRPAHGPSHAHRTRICAQRSTWLSIAKSFESFEPLGFVFRQPIIF